jgi:hypothetical protein
MSVEMRDIQALERELSSLPPYRAPDELRRSLRARLVSEPSQRPRALGWLGIAFGRAAALAAAAVVLLLSGVGWAIVASAPGDPLYPVKDAIVRLISPAGSEIQPLPASDEAPATVPTAVPVEMLAPPSIAPADGADRSTLTQQPAVSTPAVTMPVERATAEPSFAPRATPAVPPSPPGPRATPAVPPDPRD